MLAQLHGQVTRLGLLGLLARTMRGGAEELRIVIAAELMAQHAKGAGAVAEGTSDVLRGSALKKIGPKGLVHALAGLGGLRKEAAAFCYVFRYP